MAEPKPSVAELLAQYEESRPKALDERFTQPVPPEAGPFQQIIPEEETYRDMAERTLAGVLGDDRQAFRRAGKLLDTADQLPVLGDASAAADVMQAVKDRDMLGLGIAGLGVIPGMSGMARKIRGSVNEQMELPFETRASDQLFSTTPTTEDPFSGLRNEINRLDQKITRLDSGLVQDQASASLNNATLDPRTIQNTQENISKLTGQKYDLEDQLQDLIKRQTNADPRLQRAVDLGFDITRPVYHGTNVNFREFDPKKRGTYTEAKDAKLGFFFTDNPKMASTYVETDLEPYATSKNFLIRAAEKVTKGGYGKFNDAILKAFGQQPITPEAPQVLPLFLKRGKEKMVIPLRGKQGNEYKEEFFTQELKKAQEEGYDSVTFRDVDDVLFREGSEKPEVLTGNVTIVFNPANIRSINADFSPDAKDSADLMLAKGGMVTNMNRPVISRGLSNLIRNYSQGPLARLDVPRETVPVQGMFEGGMPRNFNPFATGRELTEREEEVQAQMAAEALADDAPLPPVPLNQAQQKAYRQGLLQMDDLGYGRPENNEFLYLGDTSTETSGNVPNAPIVTQTQGTSGTGDTSPIEDGPASPPIQETIADAPLSDPTVPFTMPEVIEETTEQQTTTTQPTTQTTTTQPIQQTTTTTTQQPQQPVGTGRTPDQVMADRAAEEAAAAEAERIRLANLAAQEQLAAEQLAAEQAATVAAEEEQQRLLQAQQAAEAAAQAEEQERIALDQQLAQELAAQEQAQLAAQQNIDTQVLGAEQLVDQQAADRALLEAQLANQDDPTAVFQAPPPDTVDRGSFGVPPAISTQAVDPNAPNFLVADMIDEYTSGYAPTLGMDIKETVYPYQGMTEQEMQDQGVYRAEVFQPMPKLSFGSGTQEGEEGEGTGTGTGTGQTGSGMPAIDFGSTTSGSGTKGRYVTLPTGQSVFVPDYGDISFNTENPESEPGQYGLKDEQRYQCPAYYTLAFEGGQPYCKKIDKSQWPSGGRRRVQVANLPSRTAVSIIEPKEPGSETGEGYAQGGPVQNFSLGGMALHQAQMSAMRRGAQGPFGQALFQRFQNTGFVPPPQQQNMQMLQQQQMPQQPRPGFVPQGVGVAQPMPNRLQTLIPDGPPPGSMGMQQDQQLDISHDGPGSMGNPIMDRRARFDISTRGPESFGQMGPPQQIGQVAEPNTRQLASQLQNVTQQVNQLSSHLGVSGGGQQLMTQGPSQYQSGGLQGGIGGLLQNLRPEPAPAQLRATGPVRPPMFQTFR